MAEVYVTLGEAAELERVKYNTMVKRVLRKQESFVTKTEKSENGGKDVVLVAVSSLSKQARNAWSKGQIERFFRTVCNKFTRWMKSYTGTLTGSKTSDKVDKDIKRMLERGELLTLEEFYEKWHEWLTTVYMHTEHSGLKKMGETYKKPYDCFMNEDRYFKAAPPKSYATMLMMKSENVLVRNIGITKWGYEYRSDELCDYIGRKVDIKYDPDDMAVLYVFDQKGKTYSGQGMREWLLHAAMKCSRYMELIEGSPGMKENIQRTSAQG